MDDPKLVEDAVEYIKSEQFEEHLGASGLPDGLREALREVIELSPIPRWVTVRAILGELQIKGNYWPKEYKKAPAELGLK